MNSTCIILRTEGPNIYMYRRGRLYKKKPWRNTIIEKANTYLISSPQIYDGSTTLSLEW
jgi:hypothetical protein